MTGTFLRNLTVYSLVLAFAFGSVAQGAPSDGGNPGNGAPADPGGGQNGPGNSDGKGNDGTTGGSTQSPPPANPRVTCQVIENPTIPIASFIDRTELPEDANTSTRFPDMTLLQAYCYADMDKAGTSDIKINGSFQISGYKPCSSSTSGLCTIEAMKGEKTQASDFVLSTKRKLVAQVLVRNIGDKAQTLESSKIRFRFASADSVKIDTASSDVGFSAAGGEKTLTAAAGADAKCSIVVSGALDAINSSVAVPEVNVSNGVLKFKAVVSGASGLNSQVQTTQWSGGPSADGVWETAPSGVVSQVDARVTTFSGKTLECAIKVRPMGQSHTVKLQKYGDCEFFSALRSYYFLDPANKKLQNGGYSKPLRFAGLNGVQYGKTSADVPFRGVMNGAASVQGVINSGLNGLVTLPPIDQRLYSKAVIVARPFSAKTGTVGDEPVAWGTLDLSNYNLTRLEMLKPVSDNDEVVFQVYLAHKQVQGGVDIRGTSSTEAAALYRFSAGSAAEDPIDRIVPFVNDSCALMVVSVPTRSDKSLPPELSSAKLCSFSKPYSFANFKAGRVALSLLHMVPEHGTQAFPSDLIKASHQPTCSPSVSSNQRSCWNISAAAMGQSDSSDPFTDHTSCRTYTTTTKSQKVCDSYGCRTYEYPVTVVNYKPSCNVVETNGECGRNMAIRFSGYNQMMLAALGCSAKYDALGQNTSGVPVTATLKKQGILPYTSFGGSAPMHYTNYPASQLVYGTEPKMGYACVPCRFATYAKKALDSDDETAKLPVDQDSTVARKPVYSFTKSEAPAECVREIEFEVRYFGAGACDGVNDVPGNLCASDNLKPQNCTTSDVYNGTLGSFGGGGNVAGKFKIPICPGSGFEYDNVSVSWSPIIVDVTGNGINISRDFKLSVLFDIKGNGRPVKVDWPVNTGEVAFLVRPDKNGKVNSIRELFGDFKAKNGFEALRALDGNRDGVIDRKDAKFGGLALWFDRNRNGVADAGEIEPLDVWGVGSVPLNYARPVTKGIEGKTLSTAYFNNRREKFLNVEDHYFYEYQQNGKKVSKAK